MLSAGRLLRIVVGGLTMAIGAGARTGALDATPRMRVTICMSDTALHPDSHIQIEIENARVIASRIFKTAGVVPEWRKSRSNCAGENGKVIVVTFSDETTAGHSAEALAYALPFEGTHIVVFYDRVIRAVSSAQRLAPILLGHVLAHEITHILQACDQHAETGVMKAHWSRRDYERMTFSPLRFTPVDVELIHIGPWGEGYRDQTYGLPRIDIPIRR